METIVSVAGVDIYPTKLSSFNSSLFAKTSLAFHRLTNAGNPEQVRNLVDFVKFHNIYIHTVYVSESEPVRLRVNYGLPLWLEPHIDKLHIWDLTKTYDHVPKNHTWYDG